MLCPDGGFGDWQGYTRSLSPAPEVSNDDPESLMLCWRLQTVGRSSSIHRWRTAGSLVQWLFILPLVGTRSTTKSSRVLGLASTHSGVNKHRTKEAVTGDGRKGRYRTQGKHEFARAGRHTTSEQRTRTPGRVLSSDAIQRNHRHNLPLGHAGLGNATDYQDMSGDRRFVYTKVPRPRGHYNSTNEKSEQ